MTGIGAVLARLEPRLGAISEGPLPLEGGITNRNFSVRFGTRRCVVRLPGKDTSLLGISRQAELLANQAAAELGIAPQVVAADEDCLVTEYVAGRPADPETLGATPERVARALRAFHDSGVQLPVEFWVPDLLDSYAEVIGRRGARLPGWFHSARTAAARVGEMLPLTERVPSHNDLLVGNLMWLDSGAVMLVDWEYAGMGHRLFDLANLAAGAELGPEAEERLLTAYFGAPASEQQRKELRLMRIVSDAREAAWGAVQAVVSELEFDFDGYAGRHFERLAGAAAQELELHV